jgi:hypothetical protein
MLQSLLRKLRIRQDRYDSSGADAMQIRQAALMYGGIRFDGYRSRFSASASIIVLIDSGVTLVSSRSNVIFCSFPVKANGT